MANRPNPKSASSWLDTFYGVCLLLVVLTVISFLTLSVCVLILSENWLFRGLSIGSLIGTASATLILAVLWRLEKPKEKQATPAIIREPASIEEMSGVQFEEYVAGRLLEASWSDVTLTPATGDHGVDIVAVHTDEKYVIQCKRYRSPVDTKAVQEIYTGKGIYDADHAVVITNSTYTNKAKEMAEKLHVELWNIETLNHLADQ